MVTNLCGSVTEVLIVGSQHIGAELPDSALKHTLERLIAWQPDMVAIEILPGELVELYERQGEIFSDLKHGGYPLARKLRTQAQMFTGWNRAEALLRISDVALPTQERVLGYLVLCEPWNALLHWTPNLALPKDLNQELAKLADSKSESVRLGVAVAKRLGHQKLCLFDDFPVFDLTAEQWEEYGQGVQTSEFRSWMKQHPFTLAYEAAQEKSRVAGDYWSLLCDLNSTEMVTLVGEMENEANLRMGLAGRAKQADWDARNLFMAGRLRVATGEHIGGRILVIVGNSHKGPLETALKVLGPDIRLVPFKELPQL